MRNRSQNNIQKALFTNELGTKHTLCCDPNKKSKVFVELQHGSVYKPNEFTRYRYGNAYTLLFKRKGSSVVVNGIQKNEIYCFFDDLDCLIERRKKQNLCKPKRTRS
jgi:hypothetical protein